MRLWSLNVMTVIINLKKARDEKGMSLNDLARASGLSPQYLSKLENNNGNPSLKVIDAICKGLSMSSGQVDWIEFKDDSQTAAHA